MAECSCTREVLLVAGLFYGGGFLIFALTIAVYAIHIIRTEKKSGRNRR